MAGGKEFVESLAKRRSAAYGGTRRRRGGPGGAGGIELLYLLTRLLRPALALETGVAADWSTAAMLAAMRANGTAG
ncbi:hypothetical protein [Microbispora sp. H10836]|uniref:hypothetical protein n=1 Tax=Microbispora sp. H10836 TaxID=2729106 RepID=UPI001476403D|nr:hypothetical protein [Microbispora sp. H10836]